MRRGERERKRKRGRRGITGPICIYETKNMVNWPKTAVLMLISNEMRNEPALALTNQ